MEQAAPQSASPLPPPRTTSALTSPMTAPRVEMPARLVFIRHGQSEANIIQRAVKRGQLTAFPPKFLDTPDREFRLSALGQAQAKTTGAWLRAQYPEGFDIIYVSDHVRAQETAGLLCLAAGWNNAQIRVDPQLGERNWGRFSELTETERTLSFDQRKRDPLHTPMPDGESLLATRTRSRVLLERVARECTNQRVLVFSHGEYIEAAWAEIAHMTTEQQRDFFHSPAGDMKNCQVVEFSSLAPEGAESDGRLRWVRSSCPQAKVEGDWARIIPRKFSPEELLESAARYPHLAAD